MNGYLHSIKHMHSISTSLKSCRADFTWRDGTYLTRLFMCLKLKIKVCDAKSDDVLECNHNILHILFIRRILLLLSIPEHHRYIFSSTPTISENVAWLSISNRVELIFNRHKSFQFCFFQTLKSQLKQGNIYSLDIN